MPAKKHIYILHGWAYSAEKWESFLQNLDKNFEYTLLKIPGLTAPLNKTWDINDYLSWLEKSIGNKKNVILLGHSNGGRLSLSYAIKHPQNLDALILIDSAGIVDQRLKSQFKRAIFKSLAKFGKVLFPSESARNLLYKLAREKDYKEAPLHLRKTMSNLISCDFKDRLHQITSKTLIIWGEHDQVTPIADAKTFHKLIPKSKLVIIDNARHSPMFTHPEKVSESVAKFLL